MRKLATAAGWEKIIWLHLKVLETLWSLQESSDTELWLSIRGLRGTPAAMASHSLSIHEMDLQFRDPKFPATKDLKGPDNNYYLLLGSAAHGEGTSVMNMLQPMQK